MAAYFGYMKGVANELALRHVKEVVPHNDTFAGPTGRRGDQVGGFTMMLREDLQRMVPYWISYTEAVRADPEVSPSQPLSPPSLSMSLSGTR